MRDEKKKQLDEEKKKQLDEKKKVAQYVVKLLGPANVDNLRIIQRRRKKKTSKD